MKTYLLNYLGILILSVLLSNHLYSQSKFEISGGAGLPELLNIKIKYGLNFQIGTSIGFLQVEKVEYRSYSIDFYGHFAGESKHINQRPWFLIFGLNYLIDKGRPFTYGGQTYDDKDSRYLNICTGIGRTFNLSPKIGIAINIGLVPDFMLPEFYFYLLPSAGISFFIRF
jgi:hypothetical protein